MQKQHSSKHQRSIQKEKKKEFSPHDEFASEVSKYILLNWLFSSSQHVVYVLVVIYIKVIC